MYVMGCRQLFIFALFAAFGGSAAIELELPSLPNTGFVSAVVSGDDVGSIIFKTTQRINLPGFCRTIELVGLPQPNSSPLVGSSIFRIIETSSAPQLFNDHFAWTNGKETLSYVPSGSSEYGNWLIGNKAGVDSGYVHISTITPTFTPIGLDGLVASSSVHGSGNVEGTTYWKWLQHGKWESQPQMKAVCRDALDDLEESPHFYTVEYFDSGSEGRAANSILLPAASVNIAGRTAESTDYSYVYLRRSTNEWVGLIEVEVLAEYGVPVRISPLPPAAAAGATTASGGGGGGGTGERSKVGVLVNAEHGGHSTWRCAFRVVDAVGTGSTSSDRDSTRGSTSTGNGNAPRIDDLPYQLPSSSSSSSSSIPTSPLDGDGDSTGFELMITLHGVVQSSTTGSSIRSRGKRNWLLASLAEDSRQDWPAVDASAGLVISPLPRKLKRSNQIHTLMQLRTVQPGDYLWLWITAPKVSKTNPNNPSSTTTTATATVVDPTSSEFVTSFEEFTTSTSGGGLSVPVLGEGVMVATEELLVRCHRRSASRIVLQYFPTDRRDSMRQSVLDRDTDFLVLQLHPTTTSSSSAPTTNTSSTSTSTGAITNTMNTSSAQQPFVRDIFFQGHRSPAVALKGLIPMGPHVLEYVRRYLLQKEAMNLARARATNAQPVSACYFYHAAVSMPQALIYAAEIMCVLLGAKPVTMIQYTTAADFQWKFPMVQELVRSIVSARQVAGASFAIGYEVFRYRSDETLILYRAHRHSLALSLLPMREAQALHPVPYPDNSAGADATKQQLDWRAQIYNSAFNGFVLGYPDYFVRSYCEDFHNSLDVWVKREQFRLAERDFQSKILQPFLQQQQSQQQLSSASPLRIRLGFDEPISTLEYELIMKNV